MKSRNDIVSLQSRRDFLKQSIWLGLLAGTGTLFDSRPAFAAGNQVVNNRVLAEIFLGGGPDLRHGFPPVFSATAGSFGNSYWKNKATAYDDGTGLATDNATLQAYYNANFTTVSSNGISLGILNKCDWLIQQFNAGHVALISNVFGSASRDHDHATKVMDYGDTTIPKNYVGSGWGGRLAFKASGNSLAISGFPRAFSFGPDPATPTVLTSFSDQNVIIASDMRNYGLYDVDPGISSVSVEQRVARDLRLYYAQKRKSIVKDSTFARFFDAEEKIRTFSNQIDERLASFPEPADLQNWIQTVNSGLGTQLRNLHDALACSDIVNLRVASLEFNGWDSHNNQKDEIEPNLQALFGVGQGLDLLYRNLSASAQSNLVFVLGGEFGRQIRSNDGRGTDHGVGNLTIMIGNGVKGGCYGTMFPQKEVDILAQPNKFVNPDIEGLNAIDHVFGRACDWVSPNSKSFVFPAFASKPLESLLANQLPTLFA